MIHDLIIPAVSKSPFVVKINSGRGWVPGYPFHTERDYFIVYEVAKMLVKRKVIRREVATVNRSSELGNPKISTATVTGIDQVRKWIAQDNKRNEREVFPNRNMKSRKFGWQIPKQDFAEFYSDMTGGMPFVESEYLDCLLHPDNLEYITYQEEEIRKKIEALNNKIKRNKGDISDMRRKKRALQEALDNYRIEYLKVAFK